jgi:hypothetical protein
MRVGTNMPCRSISYQPPSENEWNRFMPDVGSLSTMPSLPCATANGFSGSSAYCGEPVAGLPSATLRQSASHTMSSCGWVTWGGGGGGQRGKRWGRDG